MILLTCVVFFFNSGKYDELLHNNHFISSLRILGTLGRGRVFSGFKSIVVDLPTIITGHGWSTNYSAHHDQANYVRREKSYLVKYTF